MIDYCFHLAHCSSVPESVTQSVGQRRRLYILRRLFFSARPVLGMSLGSNSEGMLYSFLLIDLADE